MGLFTLGMGYQAINEHIREIYGLKVSAATISVVTDKLIQI